MNTKKERKNNKEKEMGEATMKNSIICVIRLEAKGKDRFKMILTLIVQDNRIHSANKRDIT